MALAVLSAFALGSVAGEMGGQVVIDAPPGAVDPSALTLVVYHEGVEESVALARRYAEVRGIDEGRLIGLDPPQAATITREQFDQTMRDPLRVELEARGLWQVERSPLGSTVTGMRVRFVALMHGLPRRIEPLDREAPAGREDAASVDSELAALAMLRAPLAGPLQNPYFRRDEPAVELVAPVLLVSRLDAGSAATAGRMLTDSLAAERDGVEGFAYIDYARRTGGYQQGEQWLEQAEQHLWAAGVPVVAERHNTLWLHEYPMDRALVYLGWYANHVEGPFLSGQFRFQRGAIAVHIHSFSAQAVVPDRHWVGPLLERGAAVALGNVYEPYLGLTTHLDLFTERLLAGYTLAEAAWMATPALSWMSVVHGDPLYRPFPRGGAGRGVGGFAPADSAAEWLAAKWGAGNQGDPDDGGDGGRLTTESVALVVAEADRRDDAWLMEAAGLAWQRLDEPELAADAFQRAAAMSQRERDQLRHLLHEAELLRAGGRLEMAVELLRRRAPGFQDPAVREGLEAVLLQLDPPSP